MNKCFILCVLLLISKCFAAQNHKVRPWTDTVGFSHTAAQTDSVLKRILRIQTAELKNKISVPDWKTLVCPHDDYTYTGYMYPIALSDVKAKTIILFGVAHKAKLFKLENKIVFDSYEYWQAPYGNIKVSPLREELMNALPAGSYLVSDTMQKAEHSVEAIIPFLQYYKRDVQIVSILVPYMPFSKMDSVAKPLAQALKRTLAKHKMEWGKDVAIVISNDAVHYGDEDWGGRNFARYGADTAGYRQAVDFEHKLISETLEGGLSPAKLKEFNAQTVSERDYHDYKWTWCGRYSVPFGLLTSFYLQELFKAQPLQGKLIDYSTSLQNKHIPVNDLRMGITAPCTIRHWVGYAVIKYR